MKLPVISILIPTLKRPEGLKRCYESIKMLNYPPDLLEVWIREDDPRIGVPKRIKQGVEETCGEYIVYASNDVEFTPDSLINALNASIDNNKGLVSFNTGKLYPDKGNICEHFLIKRSLIEKLDNKEIFCTGFHHVSCDNYLWAQCDKMGEAMRAENAIVHHYHFSKGSNFDEVYKLAWESDNVKEDRELLKKKLEELYKK